MCCHFWFYVVDSTAPPLEIAVSNAIRASGGVRYVRPADTPVTFMVTPPAGLTNLEVQTTTTMPGFILEEGTTSTLIYTYDAQKLAKEFPNLDLHDADGFAGVDTITISFLLSGTDSTGTRKHFARQIVIQGEELQMPERGRRSFLRAEEGYGDEVPAVPDRPCQSYPCLTCPA